MMDRWLLELIHAWHGNGILLYVLITTSTAGVLSSLIGLERQLRGEAAGIRTHALLAIASSLLMTISVWAIRMADGSINLAMGTIERDLSYDTSRIAAAAVTGVGFLGGSVIIKNKNSVRGLATASTLWICTAVGLACGAGFIIGAAITVAVVLTVLILFSSIVDRIDSRFPAVTITADSHASIIAQIRRFSDDTGFIAKTISVVHCDEEKAIIIAHFQLRHKAPELAYVRTQLSQIPGVVSVE